MAIQGVGSGQSISPARRDEPGQKAIPRVTFCRRFLKVLGPGLITGASDDDPSGIGTYAVAGATLGYAPLWTALVTFPMMVAVQYTCAKIGMVSGHGLTAVLRRHYSRGLL
jgi:Mn2+/Fe2+ NRAMP family transporter